LKRQAVVDTALQSKVVSLTSAESKMTGSPPIQPVHFRSVYV
jgi:hypothetical protein